MALTDERAAREAVRMRDFMLPDLLKFFDGEPEAAVG